MDHHCLPVTHTYPQRRQEIKYPELHDDESPIEFFNKLEWTAHYNRLSADDKVFTLRLHLHGKTSRAFCTLIDEEDMDNYDHVKATLLEALGDTPTRADWKWWQLHFRQGDYPMEYAQTVLLLNNRRLKEAPDRKSVLELVALYKFLHSLPAEMHEVCG